MKLKPQKLFLLFFFIFSFSFLVFHFTFASTAGEALSEKTRGVFVWVIGIATLVAGVSFVVGAVQYLFSLENEATKKDARSRMFASIFGLIICLASILILNQINPEIAKLNFGEPTGKKFPGIYYSNGNSDQDIPAPMSNSNILNTTEIQNI